MKKEIYETPECVMLELNVSSAILSASSESDNESYSDSYTNDWYLEDILKK